jgi:hypothetical protein
VTFAGEDCIPALIEERGERREERRERREGRGERMKDEGGWIDGRL